jgi:hypothetical protein
MDLLLALASGTAAISAVVPVRRWWRVAPGEAVRAAVCAAVMLATAAAMIARGSPTAQLLAGASCFPFAMLAATGRAAPLLRAHRGLAVVAMALMLLVAAAGGAVTAGGTSPAAAIPEHGHGASAGGVVVMTAVVLVLSAIVMGAAAASGRRVGSASSPSAPCGRPERIECLATAVASLVCLTHVLPV